MFTGFIIISIFVILTRIYKIYKNNGVTDIQTEVFEVGSHLISSSIIFLILVIIFNM
jgi:hypothetical protein